jgi:glutaminase
MSGVVVCFQDVLLHHEAHMTPVLLQKYLDDAHEKVYALGSTFYQHLDIPGMCGVPAAAYVAGMGTISVGSVEQCIALMSAIKPFLLLYAMETHGAEQVDEWVDDRPSGKPYHSISQLRQDGGRPRNAMINSGAMLLASHVRGGTPLEKQQTFVDWLHGFCPDVSLQLHESCLDVVVDPASDPTNAALAAMLKKHGHITDAEQVYETYFRLCCLGGTVVDVARLGHALAVSSSSHRDRVIHTLSHSGLYEGTPRWCALTSLPAKSAVSGMMFAIYPDKSCLAACDKWLDGYGNPALPQRVLAAAGKHSDGRATIDH